MTDTLVRAEAAIDRAILEIEKADPSRTVEQRAIDVTRLNTLAAKLIHAALRQSSMTVIDFSRELQK